MKCLYSFFLITILCSCGENPCKKELTRKEQQHDSLQNLYEKYRFRKDSLKNIFNSSQGKFLTKKDISFNISPTNAPQKKGNDLAVEAGLVLVPERTSFIAVQYESKENQSNDETSNKIKHRIDTVYPSKQTNYIEILINSSTVDDTIGINYNHYQLYYVFRENDTMKTSIKYEYRVIE